MKNVPVLRRAKLLDRLGTTDHLEHAMSTSASPSCRSTAAPTAHRLHQVRIVGGAKITCQNAWVTDLVPTATNLAQLVRTGRAHWKIENAGFNTLKNHGYHLERNSATANPRAQPQVLPIALTAPLPGSTACDHTARSALEVPKDLERLGGTAIP